ncbi:hypothetical protein AVEN_57276-1 [Araneus ventricosus]|uniref:Uncharacterized protein n=1 Tax=Araneus ventricosus TaxID=182803 RepID=A0A4Y2Q858_ARAVE|nr:hypothetical protein AVEN_62289-1 [Araneus ventricosus]GBN59591.1 hypothetical protein AVEN_57276-1 [Araneus ventricosus]
MDDSDGCQRFCLVENWLLEQGIEAAMARVRSRLRSQRVSGSKSDSTGCGGTRSTCILFGDVKRSGEWAAGDVMEWFARFPTATAVRFFHVEEFEIWGAWGVANGEDSADVASHF